MLIATFQNRYLEHWPRGTEKQALYHTSRGTDSPVTHNDAHEQLFIQPLLFSGTIRSNLDPFSLHDDAKLHAALRKAFIIRPDSKRYSRFNKGATNPSARLTLDSIVEPEGLNLSVGERSLVCLARALVKDTRIVVMDEATYVFRFVTNDEKGTEGRL